MFGRKKSELERLAEKEEEREYAPRYADESGGIMSFFRDRGVRETFESILIAIALALLFRNFLGEAYIIPTGSMANALQGRHVDLMCEKCQFQYRTGASIENNANGEMVTATVCPICKYPTSLKRGERRDHRPYAGDRILVNKFIYDFESPGRWDVIVFKYPNNGKQNYIKRCVGLPGENLLIENGDIFTYDPERETFADRKIQRKEHRKLLAMLQLVHDSAYLPEELVKANWPSRWRSWTGDTDWKINRDSAQQSYSHSGQADEMQWINYRHAIPQYTEWKDISSRTLPDRIKDGFQGELITDFYAYNESQISVNRTPYNEIGKLGLHWVGDLALECTMELKSGSGQIAFDLVEGGVHFTCTIDVKTGKAQITASDESVQFVGTDGGNIEKPEAETRIKRPGRYQIRFANADDQLYLWVNNKPVDLGIEGFSRSGQVVPQYSKDKPGDAQPLGIGVNGAEVDISRIRVLRDIYYASDNSSDSYRMTGMEYDRSKLDPILKRLDPKWNEKKMTFRFESDYRRAAADLIADVLRTPALWETEIAQRLFACRERDESDVFELKKCEDPAQDQFLPMGDNSPCSKDARVWGDDHFVERSFLLGRAMYIYWPHAKSKPVPFTPNFERMKLIR